MKIKKSLGVILAFLFIGPLSVFADDVDKKVLEEGKHAKTLAFSPDGDALVMGIKDQVILRTGDDYLTKTTLAQCTSNWPVRSVAFSKDGTLVTSCAAVRYNEPNVKFWNIKGKPKEITNILNHDPNFMIFSSDDSMLATASRHRLNKNQIFIWDVKGDKPREKLKLSQVGFDGFCNAIAFSPNNQMLASCSGKNIKIWNLKSGTHKSIPVATWEVRSISFNKQGILAAGTMMDNGNEVKLWDLRDKNRVINEKNNAADFITKFSDHYDEHINALAFSEDGNFLAVGSNAGSLKLWEVDMTSENLSLKEIQYFEFENAEVRTLAFSPDGENLVVSLDGFDSDSHSRVIMLNLNKMVSKQ